MGFAISLPSVVTRGVGSEALQGGAISVNSPFVSLYCTLKSVHDMGSSFAPNHIGMPLVSPKLKLDFLRRQVLMSRNISGGPPISVFMGGLNMQIEHNLFPSMARPQLRKAQPLVAAYCAAQGVPCTRTTLWQSYRIVIGYLNTVRTPRQGPLPVPDRSTPRPLTLPIQLPALRARHSSFLRWRRTQNQRRNAGIAAAREPDGERERVRDAEETTICAGDDQCSVVPTLPSFVSANNRFSFDSCRCSTSRPSASNLSAPASNR